MFDQVAFFDHPQRDHAGNGLRCLIAFEQPQILKVPDVAQTQASSAHLYSMVRL